MGVMVCRSGGSREQEQERCSGGAAHPARASIAAAPHCGSAPGAQVATVGRLARTGWLVAAAIAVVVALEPGTARCQSAETVDDALARTLTGAWTLVGPVEAAQARVEVAIAAVVLRLPPLINAFAAEQLRARLMVSPTVVLAVSRARIEARFDRASYDTVPGIPTTYVVPDGTGESMEIVQLVRNGALEQVFTTPGGRRWNTFTPSADGTALTLDVVLHSVRLPTDARYRITYRRAG
jgi:hypothetical protein